MTLIGGITNKLGLDIIFIYLPYIGNVFRMLKHLPYTDEHDYRIHNAKNENS